MERKIQKEYMQKKYASYLAECLGTFTLSFVVSLSLLGNFPIAVPVAAAMTLGLLVYSIGHISGTHINPAVTIGLLAIKKISPRDAAAYIAAQVVGALLAMGLAHLLGVHLLDLPGNSLMIGAAEAIGTFFFTFGIAAVVSGRVPKALAGAIVGGSLLLGIITAAASGSAGFLNPAVALAVGMLSPMYLVGPIVGSLLGFSVYTQLDKYSQSIR